MDMAQKLIYPAIFYPDETGGFTVDVPDLPGCVTQGDNISDAIDMAVDAAGGWIMTELEDGNAVPDASPLHKIVPDADIAPDGFIHRSGYNSLFAQTWEADCQKESDHTCLARNPCK